MSLCFTCIITTACYSKYARGIYCRTLLTTASLFRPFMKLDLSDIGLYPRELATYCATEISKLMNALRGMYGLRRTSLAVSSIVLSASTVHLMNLPSQGAAVQLTQAMRKFIPIF
jgi:hypothetical protein